MLRAIGNINKLRSGDTGWPHECRGASRIILPRGRRSRASAIGASFNFFEQYSWRDREIILGIKWDDG